MIRIAVSGSRDHRDVHYIEDSLAKHVSKDVQIFVGDCRGADAIVRTYCKEKGIPCQVFVADWNKHGRAAGPVRNKEMIKTVTMLVAFPLGESRGTWNAIQCAREKKIPVHVYEKNLKM